jgi:DHA2 family lincomycin resistance protein-like MFS transporter
MFGTFVLLPIYLADIQHFDTWQIGVLLMPGALLMGLLGPYVGRLFDKVGPRPLIIPAMFVISAVLWAMTLLGTDTWWPLILVGHLVMSVGFAFMFGPLFTASLGSINPQLYSHGSALLGSINQVGGAAGIALFVAIMSAQSAALTQGGVVEIEALAGGIRMAFMVGAAISLLAVVAAFFVQRPPQQEGGWGGGH